MHMTKSKRMLADPYPLPLLKLHVKFFFQYAGVTFMVFVKLEASFEAMNCCTVSLKFLVSNMQLSLLLPLFP